MPPWHVTKIDFIPHDIVAFQFSNSSAYVAEIIFSNKKNELGVLQILRSRSVCKDGIHHKEVLGRFSLPFSFKEDGDLREIFVSKASLGVFKEDDLPLTKLTFCTDSEIEECGLFVKSLTPDRIRFEIRRDAKVIYKQYLRLERSKLNWISL